MAIDIQLIKNSLGMFESRRDQFRRRFYETLFNEHPQLASVFDEANRAAFRELFDRALTLILRELGTPDKLEASLTELGRRNRRSYLKPEYTSVYREVFVATLEEVMGPDLSPDSIAAWDEVVGLGLTMVQRGWQDQLTVVDVNRP